MINTVQETTRESLAGTMTFPEVVQKLAAIGVESYRVDLIRNEKTVFMPNGESIVEKLVWKNPAPAAQFSFEGVQAAVKRSQAKEIDYQEFLRQIMAAGTTFYMVYLNGKKVVYFGRNGEMNIEGFPIITQ